MVSILLLKIVWRRRGPVTAHICRPVRRGKQRNQQNDGQQSQETIEQQHHDIRASSIIACHWNKLSGSRDNNCVDNWSELNRWYYNGVLQSWLGTCRCSSD